MKKRWYFLGAFLLVLVIGYHVACSWAKTEIKRRAHEVLGVSVEIDDLGFSFLSGSIFLKKIEVQQLPFLGDALSIEEARVLPDYDVLWNSQFRAKELRMIRPKLSSQLALPALPPLGDIKRLRETLKKQSKKEKQILLPQPLDSIVVEDGTLEVSLIVGKSKPNALTLSHINYQNHDLSTLSPMTLLTDAVYSFDIREGHLEKSPGRFVVKNLDLSLLTKSLSPSESLRFSGGTLDLVWQDGIATIDLKNAKLTKDISIFSINKEFNLSFTIPIAEDAEARADVRLVAAEFWTGFWTKLLEGASDEIKKKLLQEAIDSVKGD
jgi:hypothetical protein